MKAPTPVKRTTYLVTVLLLVTIVVPIGGYGVVLMHSRAWATPSRSRPNVAVAPVMPDLAAKVSTPRARAPGLVVHRFLRLSDSRFRSIRSHLFALVNRDSPRLALVWLAATMQRDPEVLRSCHALVHEIGHAAYWKYGDFARALIYQDDLCGSGYMHGVVEARLAGVSDVYAELQRICAAYALSRLAGKCYHGVGHGLMNYTHNDVPRSLQLCDNYDLPIVRIRCSEGVFMENFNTDQKAHPSRYLRASDPMYPCPVQTTFYKGTCYYYAPIYYLSLHYEDYAGALRWCTHAEPHFIVTCVTGVGSRIEKQNIANPRFVERMCATAGSSGTGACIDGMVSYYLVNFDSVSKGFSLCRSLQPAHQRACYWAVESRRTLFGA
ncbi:MAG: hypothetical protein NVS2B16_11270 [Chloroflexota bacterium]